MNARGEWAGRLALALLASMCGKEVLYPDEGTPIWFLKLLILGIFVLGYWFALAPEVSKWIDNIWGEKEK